MNCINSYSIPKRLEEMEVLYSDNAEAIREYLSTPEGLGNINNEDTSDKCRDTPLYGACKYNRNDVVDVLIQFGVNVNQLSRRYRETPLSEACKNGHIDVVNRLLQAGADPNIPDNTGTTPIMYAAINCHLTIVKLLTIYDNFNTVNKSGNTIFAYAISSNDDDMIDYAFDYCTDINHTADDGWSYLHQAVFWKNKHTISVLLNKHIDVNIQDNIGRKAINLTHNPEIIALLSSA